MTSPVSTATPAAGGTRVSMFTLSTFVVGSMIGAGVFSLPSTFAESTGVAGALISWAIAGGGMLMLALVFHRLALRRPDLDAGIFSYAKAGFGNYLGFFAAFGYWASACVGNVFYWVFITSTLGGVFPELGEGNTLLAVAVSSVGIWLFFLLIRRGVRQAASLNRIVTVAKVLPIVVFVVLCLTVFDPAVFAANWGGGDMTGLGEQIRATMLVTVFVFIGIEGASVNSRHARRRSDVGRATVLGFVSVLAVFASVTIVSYGVLPRAELATLRQPSMGGVLEQAVGGWGAVFVAVALIVAVLGAYLAWTLMAAEVLLSAAQAGDLPAFLRRTNENDTPIGALTLSTVLAQVMLVVVLFAQNAFDAALELTSALVLIPFFLSAAYGLKLAIQDGASRRTGELIISAAATIYTAYLLWAAGLTYLLLCLVIIVPGTILYVIGRREQRARVFTPVEAGLFAVAAAGAVIAVILIAVGAISI
ncbi:arginine:ornithine antiporter, APA family [Microbacterium sp. LKL04]|uniref:basic amino acid/polyamine antiporter n=1 Tax=Microbacterium sp. LKL04 TaxID=912630 RepID=UPI000875E63B|nr:basic amino acid/polyamine antiporter [Microbacterium sp. LKL04]SCY30247.1 arginine:ornithine antiporter, APA family [Microbacterium sp. LKL04]